ncbi:hypothetical protein PSEUBRA_000496 [Kalmanozyma brasiliensis GHG001]|uniref:uncharacterized protein n=1 Tax=Kalmanozyma brasiliensis (strain GHG001) TaxID=1365824 RepID=UPI0028682324|nr:uncharacterized protein PSEUBRA_000496 [Kalmanozyma brasiliensis GHG001]KAF6766818.1 hypothetical protein PSEUBRA_000496 [Kalmanozyma brasiliensis GHG001]
MVFERQREGGGEGLVRELPEGAEAEERRNRGVSPVMELQRSTTAEPQRQARHLYLDPPTSPPPTLPQSTISTAHHTRLTHLSLSTSKTSLLHQPALITSSAFTSLTHLDIYPVTPEPPLSTALLTTSSTLTHLRLVLDVSGAFDNYNALWADLTGNLPRLEWLEVDPMPQQNTAPSFFDFVAQAPRLGWINGRRTDSYPPCFGDFGPDKPSGALPY